MTTAPANHVPVPSWQVTGEMLTAWGFPVQVTDKCVGSKVVVTEGTSRSEAMHAAWAAGFVRIASMPEEVRQAQLAEFHAGHEEMRLCAAETLAFLREHGTIVEGGGHAAIARAS
jgi:hypothetical protein